MSKIKILVVDDDPDWVKAMTGFLNRETDLTVIAAADDRNTAVQLCKSIDLDIVLMDINLSESTYDGILAAAEINQIKKIKIIMLTSLADSEAITQAFTAGAVNYISKSNFREIPKVIRETFNSHTPFEVLLQEYHRLKEAEQLQDLTPAEKQIYFLIESGHTQAQIAKLLFKSENTIKNQVNHILKKLKVANCREAIKKVKSKGLLDQITSKERLV